tara:strand:+ start:874 stop:1143 length:270 start_codon:yes stop_codon:yes gene_type:complete
MSFHKIGKIIEEKVLNEHHNEIIKKEIEEIIEKSGIVRTKFKVLSIEGEILTIQTDSSPARSELSFEKENIIKRINKNLKTKIKEARII